MLTAASRFAPVSRLRGEFLSPAVEEDYLEASLGETRRRLAICWAIVTLGSLAYIGHDAVALDRTGLLISAASRVASVLPGVILLVWRPPPSARALQRRALWSCLAFLPAFVGIQWLHDGVSMMSPMWFSMLMVMNGMWLAHSARNLLLSNALVLGSGVVSFSLLSDASLSQQLGLVVLQLVAFLFALAVPVTLMATRRREYQMLLASFPASVVRRLVAGGSVIEHHDDVTVLFADLVGFTTLAERLEPTELLPVLAELFVAFDQLAVEHGVETIKTIGDCYMAAAGVPEPRPDHVQRAAALALDMRDRVAAQEFGGHRLQLRVGLHCGPLVAGVVGARRQLFDLWGDTVNMASRLESHGTPGGILVSEAVARRLQDDFVLEPQGELTLRGREEHVHAWLLQGRR